MRNGWYPKQKLGNRNVPEGVNIIGSLVTMSGEVAETYYSVGYNFYKVGDWKGDKPIKVTADEICQIEIQARKKQGLSLKQLNGR